MFPTSKAGFMSRKDYDGFAFYNYFDNLELLEIRIILESLILWDKISGSFACLGKSGISRTL